MYRLSIALFGAVFASCVDPEVKECCDCLREYSCLISTESCETSLSEKQGIEITSGECTAACSNACEKALNDVVVISKRDAAVADAVVADGAASDL